MAYTKKNFKAGSVLSATQMNDMDNQIAKNQQAIGDLDKLNTNIKTTLVDAINQAATTGSGEGADLTLAEKGSVELSITWESGSINGDSGLNQSGSTNIRSDFYPIGRIKLLHVVAEDNPSQFIIFWYDENKAYLGRRESLSNSTSNLPAGVTLTVDSEAKYFRIRRNRISDVESSANNTHVYQYSAFHADVDEAIAGIREDVTAASTEKLNMNGLRELAASHTALTLNEDGTVNVALGSGVQLLKQYAATEGDIYELRVVAECTDAEGENNSVSFRLAGDGTSINYHPTANEKTEYIYRRPMKECQALNLYVMNGAGIMTVHDISLRKTEPAHGMVDNVGCNLISHQGALYGPNTMKAYKTARKMGYKRMIINHQCTNDDVLVCHHDPTFKVDNVEYAIADLTYAAFHELKPNNPTLYAALEFCAKSGMIPVIRLDSNLTQKDAAAIAGMVRKLGMVRWCECKAFSHENLMTMYQQGDVMASYDLTHSTDIGLTTDYADWKAAAYPKTYMELMTNVPAQETVDTIKADGFGVSFAAVTTYPQLRDLQRMGINYFTSDIVDPMAQW